MNGIYLPIRRRFLRRTQDEEDVLHDRHDDDESRREHKHILAVSRGLVIFWAIALCFVALAIDVYKSAFNIPILSLALGIASWTTGALLAAFLLAWLPLKINGRGLVWAAPLSVMCVISLRFAGIDWWVTTAWVLTGILLLSWIVAAVAQGGREMLPRLLRLPILGVGCAMLMWLAHNAYFMRDGQAVALAWPWWAMVGTIVSFVFGYLLADWKRDDLPKAQLA
jgi:hypothetical protein